MQADNPADGEQCPAQPMRRLDGLPRGGMHIHVQTGSKVLSRQLRISCDPGQCPRARFIKHKRLNHAKLNAQQKEQHSNHEVSVAIKLHGVTS